MDVVEYGFDTSPAHATTRDSFIPLFSGQPADYKEWRKRIHVYYRKMGSTKRHGEAVLKISSAVFKVRLGDLWKPSTLMTARKPLPLTPSSSSWMATSNTIPECSWPVTLMATLDFRGSLGDHAELHKKLEKHGVSLPTAVRLALASEMWPHERTTATCHPEGTAT